MPKSDHLRKMFRLLVSSFLVLLATVGLPSLAFYNGRVGPGDLLSQAGPIAFAPFQQICQNGNLSKAQVVSQLESWAQQYGVSSQLANTTARLQQRQQQLQTLATANLNGQALQLFNQAYNLLTNNEITRVAECEGIRSVSNGTQQEILRFVPMPPSAIPCTFYPQQCYRNIVPFARPSRDDTAGPGEINVEFVKMPENLGPQQIQTGDEATHQ